MIYSKMTMRALCLAYAAHHGQRDKMGAPYIFHPYHLAEQMDDEISCCVALLHDVVEDTPVTLEELRREFPAEVTDAVALLTHADGMDYFDYVRALAPNPVARKVKLADLAHNSDPTRLPPAELSAEKTRRRFEKYAKARAFLEGYARD